MRLSLRSSLAGYTLLETTVAAGIAAVFLGSLFAVNTAGIDTIRMARESACASQILQQRIESMRIANWHQITDAAWLQTNLLNTEAPGATGLSGLRESLVLAPYGSAAVGTTQLNRSAGTVTIVTKNTSLLLENAVQVTWTVNYYGSPNASPCTRQTVAILAKGGVAKW